MSRDVEGRFLDLSEFGALLEIIPREVADLGTAEARAIDDLRRGCCRRDCVYRQRR
jgi:hypothetical protein